MATYTKRFYSIGEVSQMLEIPGYTIRFWEDQFPMFNPNRTAKGTRKFTPDDIDMAKRIRNLLYDRGMKIDGAIEFLNKTYRKQPPRRLRSCKSKKDALALLDEVQEVLDDAHLIARIDAVKGWIEQIAQGAAFTERETKSAPDDV